MQRRTATLGVPGHRRSQVGRREPRELRICVFALFEEPEVLYDTVLRTAAPCRQGLPQPHPIGHLVGAGGVNPPVEAPHTLHCELGLPLCLRHIRF